MEKQTYVVAVEHEIMGQWHGVGARLSLTRKQAFTRHVAKTIVTEDEWADMQKVAEADKSVVASKRVKPKTHEKTEGYEYKVEDAAKGAE